MKFDANGVAVARHGLILSQDGAIHSRIVFIRVLGLKTQNLIMFIKFYTYIPLTGVNRGRWHGRSPLIKGESKS